MEKIEIREIEEDDIEKGFLDSLDFLRKASDYEKNDPYEILKKIKQNSTRDQDQCLQRNHIIFVAIDDKKIVGSTTLFIEQKFIHDGGFVGHIEDVVVRKDYERRGIGMKLVISLLDVAKQRKCYKTILNCEDSLKPFYEKIGFKKATNEMRYDHS